MAVIIKGTVQIGVSPATPNGLLWSSAWNDYLVFDTTTDYISWQ